MQTGHSIDERLLHWIAGHRVEPLTWFTVHLQDAGQSAAVLGTFGVIGLVIVVLTKAWRPAFAMIIANFVSGEVVSLLKDRIQRARPGLPDAITQVGGYAMPSTHAAFTVAPVVALLVTVRWKSRRALVIVASVLALVVVLIGVSMVYLGAHWATDVLVGWAVGIVVGAGVGAAFRPRTGQSQCAPHRSASPGHDD